VKSCAVRGVDDEIARRELAGAWICGNDSDTHATLGEQGGCDATIVAVVPMSGHDGDPASVGSAEHLERGVRHACTGTRHKGIEADGPRCEIVNTCHLCSREDWLHQFAELDGAEGPG
jgi:hypothetical protein